MRTTRERSQSPSRDTYKYVRERDRERDRESEFYTKIYTPIVNTPLTFGMEWELSSLYDDSGLSSDKKYDRADIYTDNSLKVTIEDYNVLDYYELSKSSKCACKYNIEISIGVLGIDQEVSLDKFLRNKDIFIPEVRDDLNKFLDFYIKDPNIRIEYNRNRDDIKDSDINTENHFVDCRLRQSFEDKYKHNKESYPYFYTKGPSIGMNDKGQTYLLDEGRPQITLGMSYALFTPLFKFLAEKKGIERMRTSLNIYDFIINHEGFINISNNDSKLICEGFGMIIIYFSFVAIDYIQKNIGKEYGLSTPNYFKAAFYLKPRSNLAESYKHLKREYPEIVYYVDKMKQSLKSLLYSFDSINMTDIDNIKDYDSLVSLHLNIIKSELNEQEDEDILKKIDEEKHECITDKYQDVIAYIISKRGGDYVNVSLLTYINAYYLINGILNPKKVVKLNFDRKRIKKGCKILDGYYYSYNGDNKLLIDELVSKGQVSIIKNKVYDYAHTSDAPILFVDRDEITGRITSICSSRREELFEYIPENSNLILEVRTPEKFINNPSNLISLYCIEGFLKSFFLSIKKLFVEFLDIQDTQDIPSTFTKHESIKKESYKGYGCTLMFNPKRKQRK